MSIEVAYLVSEYPSVSHSFIRREIHALERLGLVVHRYALRGWDAVLVDDSDRRERERTRYVLGQGMVALLLALLHTALTAPAAWLRAALLALRMSRDSDRAWPMHLIYLAEACVLRRWLARTAVTHLHAHFATNPAEVAMLLRELGGPAYSFTVHGSEFLDRPAQMGIEHKVGRARFVAAVSAYGRSQLMRWLPPPLWSRVSVVHCGLEPGYGDGAPACAPHNARLLCIGRLSPEKGQLLLVAAAARLQAAGRRFELVLAGDGPMRAQVQACIDAMGVGSCVRITGFLDAQRVKDEIVAARALVVPSLAEGLPVVIMEAMAHGRCVVAPYLAGIPELILPGETGWLYPAGDVDARAQALQTCLDAPHEVLQAMGAAARRRVQSRHDVDAEARRLAGQFEGAAASAPTSLTLSDEPQ